MELQQIRAGLWRWTAVHPDAEADPEPGSPADWPPEVGCVAYAAPDALVLIDPLVPRDGWPALDALAAGKKVVTLMTPAVPPGAAGTPSRPACSRNS